MASSSQQHGEGRTGSEQHLHRISEAHQNLRQILYKLRQSSFPADVAFTPRDAPNQTLLELNSAVMDYYDQVAPLRKQIVSQTQKKVDLYGNEVETDYWKQVVYTAEVPTERRLDTSLSRGQRQRLQHYNEMTDQHSHLDLPGEGDDSGDASVETEEEPVSLESVPKWEGWVRRHDAERQIPNVGRVVDTQQYQLVLPLAGAGAVFRQLNRCLRAVDLMADVQEHTVWGFEEVNENGHTQ